MTREYVWWLSLGVTLVTITSAEPCEVTLYETTSYTGTSETYPETLGEGDHYYDQDFENDWAKSMTVHAQNEYGCTIYICEHGDWSGVCNSYDVDATTGDKTEQINDFGGINGISTLRVTISCFLHSIAYYGLSQTINDHEDNLLFGFTTGSAISAPKASVVIDAYLSSGSLWRCRFVGIQGNTVYKCVEGSDHVVELDEGLNPFDYSNKLILRAYEFDSMYIKTVFIGTMNKLMETERNFAQQCVDYTWNSYTPSVSFDIIEHNEYAECDTICTDIDEFDVEQIPDAIPDATYGIDSTIGEVLVDLRPPESFDYLPINAPILEYADDIADCQWKTPNLTQTIEDVNGESNLYNTVVGDDIAGDVFDVANAIGNGLSIVSDFLPDELKAIGKIGNILMGSNNIFDAFGLSVAAPPSTEELVETAMVEMVGSMENMMECTKNYTDQKVETLRNELNDRIDDLQDLIQSNFDLLQNELEWIQTDTDKKLEAKVVQLNYKIHLENVEQEIATVQDVLKTIQRQLVYVNTITNADRKLEELRNILVNTMPRFAYAFKTMPTDTEVDFFWKLYAKEMSIYIMEVMTIRFNVWSLWLGLSNIESIADTDSDHRLAFRDLNGELIGEYISLLSMAIYSFVVDDDASEQLQRMKLTDRFAEIDLRLKPNLICTWIAVTQYVTDTTDMYFMGEYSHLFGEDIFECQTNVRETVINKLISVDAMIGGSGIYTASSMDITHTFIVNSVDYTEWCCIHYYSPCCKAEDAVYPKPTVNSVDELQQLASSSGDAIKGVRISVTATVYWRYYRTYQISKFGVIDVNDELVESDLLLETSDSDPVETFQVSCSDGYVLGALRFQLMHDESRVDVNGITGVKLLCRPIDNDIDGIEYGIFTDYEIVSASWLDPDAIVGQTFYLEWNGCPIGRIINQIDLQYHSDGEIDGENTDLVLTLEMTVHCAFSGYFDYDVDYANGWVVDIVAVAMIVISLQIVLCFVYKRKNGNKKIRVEHFDQPTDLDEMVQ